MWEQDGKKDGVDFEISYEVTSGGHAVLERMLPGTPGEMITVYHLDGDDLVLVHYCTSGNQPHMKLDSRDPEGNLWTIGTLQPRIPACDPDS